MDFSPFFQLQHMYSKFALIPFKKKKNCNKLLYQIHVILSHEYFPADMAVFEIANK